MWNEYNDNPEKVYSNILKRAKTQLPEHSTETDRFIIPKVDSQIEGNRTFFRNFKELQTLIARPESHFLKFFTNEIGTSGSVEGSRAIFQGKHIRTQVQKLFERYINDYVICPECRKPDTRFITQNRIEMLKCDACGATAGIRNLS
ncbi:MAG: translation initiation factor IF-2 subunit beta [Candidatus Heimdallarchaeota archaeon]|nr:translation initiation factor IF-2 subunit beta [Candidatus Heimdallarchaeota archaeon]MDH5647970.1 translation initiation factor IF-2 subunit beta [Candidatus Heimdallarchaeota archaeon]